MEKLADRIARHLRERKIDIKTIVRGFHTIEDWVSSRAVIQSRIEPVGQIEDAGGQEGMTYSTYKYMYEYVIGKRKHENAIGEFNITDFPLDSRLQVEVTGRDLVDIEDYLLKHRTAISEFIGPTRQNELPNNGFHLRGSRARIPFMDTNPSGQRRGAIVVDKDNVTKIVPDEEKWKIVRSRFKDVQAMVGTSTYFTDKDKPETTDIFADTARDKVSYLISYCDAMSQTRLAYIYISTCVPRVIAQASIAYHLEMLNASSYIAGELELLGSGILIKDPKTRKPVCLDKNSTPCGYRRDHYMIVRS